MATYVWVAGRGVIPKEEATQAARLQIIKDIEPYQAVAVDVATGKPPVIGSRSEHREFIKRNGYVEIGNERPQFRHTPLDSPRAELARATREILGR